MMSSLWRQFSDLEFQLRLSVPIAMIALQCLVAIWAATSKTHWFWRALAVWAAIMLMVPIRAWEPAWMFGLSSPLIIAALGIARWWKGHFEACAVPATVSENHSPPRRLRFSLLDLFLLMLIVGLWLPGLLETVQQYRPTNWLGWLMSSSAIASLTIAAYYSSQGPRRWLDVAFLVLAVLEMAVAFWLGVPVLGMIAAAAAIAAYGCAFHRSHWIAIALLAAALPGSAAAMCWAGAWMRYGDPLNIATGTFSVRMSAIMMLGAAFVLVLAVIITLARAAFCRETKLHWRLLTGFPLAVVTVGSAVWLGYIYVQVLPSAGLMSRVAKINAPNNNYDRILGIAKYVLSVNSQHESTANLRLTIPRSNVPQELLIQYQELLPLLDGSNAMPYDPRLNANEMYEQQSRGRFQVFHNLALALKAESESARTSQRLDKAVEYALATVRLGDTVGRGGIRADAEFGELIRGVGYTQLLSLRDELPSVRVAVVIATLQRSMAEREDAATIYARICDFEEQTCGWALRLDMALHRFSGTVVGDVEGFYAMFHQRYVLANLLLQTDLAIRKFEHDRGRLPSDLGELVPDYLPSVPLDAFAEPPRYRVENTHVVLYSVGWDGKDNGGKFVNWQQYTDAQRHASANPHLPSPGLDFDLDTLTRP